MYHYYSFHWKIFIVTMNVKIVSFTFSLNLKGEEVYFNHAGYGGSGSNLQVHKKVVHAFRL